jgi:hypothetical protein
MLPRPRKHQIRVNVFTAILSTAPIAPLPGYEDDRKTRVLLKRLSAIGYEVSSEP